jgi:hypothetical protein
VSARRHFESRRAAVGRRKAASSATLEYIAAPVFAGRRAGAVLTNTLQRREPPSSVRITRSS